MIHKTQRQYAAEGAARAIQVAIAARHRRLETIPEEAADFVKAFARNMTRENIGYLENFITQNGLDGELLRKAWAKKFPEPDPVRNLAILARLLHKMQGRIMGPMRHQRCRLTVRREPVGLAFRFLRRYAPDRWHRGGHHVAGLNCGPGIGFGSEWVNDSATPVRAFLINLAAE